MARDWIDPSQAARMVHHMDVKVFRRRYVNPDTRDNHELVVQIFPTPKGAVRYKILAVSVVQFLQNHIVKTGQEGDNGGK